ncbi:hypothetical protein LTR56_006588 [Elasticomyces elasticus]|nr:hypothetical protein LTR56_006588 [Elasticomyces elasticus]KAK3664524.1 hypothetical protein LTR22_004658 [Elasticomyces elasticus]KAK4931755.1 hypothetical protein LTR49_001820 [Elasticomyces elasticus]KAK5762933.1 hypothetical protein LTS12_006920 [Elasticomyces elasticus]
MPLLLYEDCSKKELAKFVSDRNLKITSSGPHQPRYHLHKSDYVKLLIAADTDRTFPFLELIPAPVGKEVAHRMLSPLKLLGALPLIKIINQDGSIVELERALFPAIDQLNGRVLAPLQPLLRAQLMREASSAYSSEKGNRYGTRTSPRSKHRGVSAGFTKALRTHSRGA